MMNIFLIKYYKIFSHAGITGLSQIKILDNGLWRRKFRYDIIYYKRASFLLDIFILCRTINIIYGILRKKLLLKKITRL